MKNLDVCVQFVDGSDQPFDYRNGRQLIQEWFTDDWGPPPVSLTLRATADDGRAVTIVVPYDEGGRVHVRVE